jgi:hypothetical protein
MFEPGLVIWTPRIQELSFDPEIFTFGILYKNISWARIASAGARAGSKGKIHTVDPKFAS